MALDERINFYGIAIQERYNSGIELYGMTIQNAYQNGLELYGITIDALNVFNGTLVVQDNDFNPITGATITLTSTQTLPGASAGNISSTTDSEGIISLTGSSTVGTSVTLEKDGFNATTISLPGMLSGGTTATMTSGGGGASKKIYTTNKGNILINPNDTILIELD